MNYDLNIHWDTGWMIIHMNPFFPCTIKKFKELMKTIDLDYRHREDHIAKMKDYFAEKIQKVEKKSERDQFKRLLEYLNKRG